MFLIWPIVAAAIFGAFCGTWVRLLPFTFVVLAGVLGSAFSMWISGLRLEWILLELFAFITALEGGYLIGLASQGDSAKPPRDGQRILGVAAKN